MPSEPPVAGRDFTNFMRSAVGNAPIAPSGRTTPRRGEASELKSANWLAPRSESAGARAAMGTTMRAFLVGFVVVAASCSSSSHVPPRPLGVQGNLTEADRHEAEAREHEQLAAAAERRSTASPLVCGDAAYNHVSTSGGERLSYWTPCWSAEASAVNRHRAAAARLHAEAREHRARARALLAKVENCAGFSADRPTPFDHREDILSVTAELQNDAVRGARVRFARVPGLTAEWMRRELTCHQAWAAALGYEPQFLPHCPAAIQGVTVEVEETPDGSVLVILRSVDPATGLAVYGRAEALLDPQLDAHE